MLTPNNCFELLFFYPIKYFLDRVDEVFMGFLSQQKLTNSFFS